MTPLPGLSFLAEESLDRADGWWRDCAERAVRYLASQGREFTADDLADMGVPAPDHPSRYGALFAAMKRAEVIRPVGYRASTRKGRNGGALRVWTGEIYMVQRESRAIDLPGGRLVALPPDLVRGDAPAAPRPSLAPVEVPPRTSPHTREDRR